MLGQLVYFFQEHGAGIVIILALTKLFYMIWYRGLAINYFLLYYFRIYNQRQLLDKIPKKRVFRRWHNVLTYLFYISAFLWGLCSFMVDS